MFTGIVEELGEVIAVEELAGAARITVRGPAVTAGARHGESIAVNGVCLTVTGVRDGTFTADVMAETLRRSALAALGPGSPVNLERPLRLDGRLGGHLVQGHVDGVGRLVSRSPAQHWDVVRIAVPAGLARYLVEKGSVAVDGVSLTVSATGDDGRDDGRDDGWDGGWDGGNGSGHDSGHGGGPWFEVSLIPATLAATTLGRLRPGGAVNIEVDVIGKYVERMLRDLPTREPAGPGADARWTAVRS